jgi:tetratricopeptide (TPR) repeat protein
MDQLFITMDRRLLQILENTTCLSKTQLEGYINNDLQPEELYAVEMHLIECPICNDAVEGFIREGNINALSSQLPTSLKLPPHKKEKKGPEAKNIVSTSHANTTGGSNTSKQYNERRPARPFNLLKPFGIAAVLILGFILLWHYQLSRPATDKPIAARMNNGPSDSNISGADQPVTQGPAAKESLPLQKDTAKTVVNKNADSSTQKASQNMAPAAAPLATAANPAKDDNVVISDADAANKKNAAAKKEESKPVTISPDSDETTTKERIAKASDAVDKKQAAKADNTPQTDYEKGLNLYHQQDYGSAILYFRTVMKDDNDPKLYNAMYYCAMSYKNMGNRRKAVKLFKELVKANAPQKGLAQKQLDAME